LFLEHAVKRRRTHPQPATISLAEACRRTGIAVSTALKLMPDDFPEAVWIGGKRVVSRERFEGWLADKIGKS
jgi:predicted DNA-binding transcriptional regulator AlpA